MAGAKKRGDLINSRRGDDRPPQKTGNVITQRRCSLLSIRLMRMGAKKKPFYRIVVAEKRTKRDGSFVDTLGYYNPCREPVEFKLNGDRLKYWIERGAQPSDTVRSLIQRKTAPAGPETA